MNPARLILAIVAVFIGVFATDFFIHGVLLKGDYAATMSLWRPETEMPKFMGWMILGQFVAAATFVVLWAKGFAEKECPLLAVMFGLFMGLFSSAGMLISYAVQPLPGALVAKWIAGGAAQGVVLGLLVFFVYKPKTQEGAKSC